MLISISLTTQSAHNQIADIMFARIDLSYLIGMNVGRFVRRTTQILKTTNDVLES